MIFLLVRKKYDGRGRTLCRNLYKTFKMGLNSYILADEYKESKVTFGEAYNWKRTFEAFESCTISTISRIISSNEASSASQSSRFNPLSSVSSLYNSSGLTKPKEPSQKPEKSSSSQMLRYAKIGAVGLGVGAVLAVTGGLAAPGIAGALFLMGTTGAGYLPSLP